jgi:hypothetical protein
MCIYFLDVIFPYLQARYFCYFHVSVPKWTNGVLNNWSQFKTKAQTFVTVLNALSMLSVTNSMELSLWEPPVAQLLNNIPGSLLPCSQEPSAGPYLEPDQSNPYHPHPISLQSILILSCHLCLGLPTDLFPCGFSTKILHAFVLSPVCTTCPAHLILLVHYPSSCLYLKTPSCLFFKTQRFGVRILSPSSGKTYTVGPNR